TVGALYQAHGDVELPGDLARVVDRDDRRVVERRREPRLAQEPLAEANILRELWREELQRHVAVEGEVAGAIDDAHPAAAEQRLDPIAGEFRARKLSAERAASRHAPPSPATRRPSVGG